MSHLHRLAAPKTYPVKRRGIEYVVKAMPGPHSKETSVPLLVVLRDILNVVTTSKEAKKVLNERKVMVDGRVVTELKFPVGFMDVISFAGKHYRVTFDFKGRIKLFEISEDEAKLKISKVIRKQMIKGGKIQITTEDGRNFILSDEDVSVGDSILFEIPSQEIKKVLKMSIGKTVFIISGKYVGQIAKLEEIIPYKFAPDSVVLERNGNKFETLKDYVVVVGDDSPEIKVVE